MFYLTSAKQDKKQVATPVVTHSTTTPDSTPVTRSSYAWQGKAADPKYITLPSIHAEGFLQQVGVDQNSQIAVPSNVHLAGWFVDTVRPGEKGLSIIDGHIVIGRNYEGIFQNLSQLKPGDTFTVTFGDGSIKTFTVVSEQLLDNSAVASVLFSQHPNITNQLTLITCGGNYDKAAGEYSQRVVIVSRYSAHAS